MEWSSGANVPPKWGGSLGNVLCKNRFWTNYVFITVWRSQDPFPHSGSPRNLLGFIFASFSFLSSPGLPPSPSSQQSRIGPRLAAGQAGVPTTVRLVQVRPQVGGRPPPAREGWISPVRRALAWGCYRFVQANAGR